MAAQTENPKQSRRALGPRALHTRQRLLVATHELLNQRSVRDVSVVEIARKVGTSPATFYQYFRDVNEAILSLAQQAADEMPAIVALIDSSWEGPEGLERARTVAEMFIDHWEEYRAVLLARNLAADQGDERFARIRRKAVAPIMEHLATKVKQAQQAETMDKEVHPFAAAAAAAIILERLPAYHSQLAFFGVTRGHLVESCARMMVHALTGRWGG